MDIQLSAYVVGLLSSVVAELFKMFPALTGKEIYKVLTAIAVMVVGTLWSLGFNLSMWDWTLFGQVVVWSFVNYKMIVQPIAKDISLRSQS